MKRMKRALLRPHRSFIFTVFLLFAALGLMVGLLIFSRLDADTIRQQREEIRQLRERAALVATLDRMATDNLNGRVNDALNRADACHMRVNQLIRALQKKFRIWGDVLLLPVFDERSER